MAIQSEQHGPVFQASGGNPSTIAGNESTPLVLVAIRAAIGMGRAQPDRGD